MLREEAFKIFDRKNQYPRYIICLIVKNIKKHWWNKDVLNWGLQIEYYEDNDFKIIIWDKINECN